MSSDTKRAGKEDWFEITTNRDLLCRRDDPYWPEAKRMAMDDRYHSEFSRQDRFHDFDHRDRGRYQDHCLDRSARQCLFFLYLYGN